MKQFMVIDTIISTPVPISILRVETEKGAKEVKIPEEIWMLWIVTDEPEYDTYNMSLSNWEPPA